MSIHDFLEKTAGRRVQEITRLRKKISRLKEGLNYSGRGNPQLEKYYKRRIAAHENTLSRLVKQQRDIYRGPNVNSFRELRDNVDEKEFKDMASNAIRGLMDKQKGRINRDISTATTTAKPPRNALLLKRRQIFGEGYGKPKSRSSYLNKAIENLKGK